VARSVGRKNALYMLLTGSFIDARTAERWGLVNQAVPADRLDATVDDLVAQLAALPPGVLRLGKEGFYRQIEARQAEAYAMMSEAIACNAVLSDGQEGIDAFVEKRAPSWPSLRQP
jgi:enoyl-CoA hydratase/carnithine racemase